MNCSVIAQFFITAANIFEDTIVHGEHLQEHCPSHWSHRCNIRRFWAGTQINCRHMEQGSWYKVYPWNSFFLPPTCCSAGCAVHSLHHTPLLWGSCLSVSEGVSLKAMSSKSAASVCSALTPLKCDGAPSWIMSRLLEFIQGARSESRTCTAKHYCITSSSTIVLTP